MKKLLWLLAAACAFLTHAYAQPEIPVDMFTGTPSVSVPFGSVSDHGVADAFGLSYNARGVAIKAASGFYGIGWGLQGGAQIVRDIRGLPDDYFGQGTDLRRGWLHSQSNVQAGAFGNTSDAGATTCTDELADYNQLAAFQYIVDTQPDMFYYDAGSYSGAFIFDNAATPTIRLIPHAAVRIVPQFTGTTLAAFTITTPDGNVYTYSLAAQESRRAVRYNASTAYVDFMHTDYALYEKWSAVAYNYAWKLVTVTAPEGGQLTYTYADETYSEKARYDPDNTIVVRQRNNSPAESYIGRFLFRWETSTHVKRLVSVESLSGAKIEFAYTVLSTDADSREKAILTKVSLIDTRQTNGAIKQFKLEYDRVRADTLNTYLPGPNDQSASYDYTNFRRSFLRYVTEYSGCEQLPPYEFTYNSPGLLPLPHSLSVDFWGYYNGRSNTHRAPKLYIYPALAPAERYRVFAIPAYSGESYLLDGADLTVNPATIKYGTLEAVQYPTGARTLLEYEPNEFYDATAGQSIYGGGVRIKKITQEDGLNASTAIVKTFAYTEDNKSSGRIGYMPSYAIPMTQYMNADSVLVSYASLVSAGMNPWIYLTARLDVDMASFYHSEATAVRYRRVTVARPGAGYAVLDYAVPGGWGSTGAGAWMPTENKFARAAACAPVPLFPQASPGIFPHTRYPNIQGEGLLMRKREYNEQGAPVHRTEYTYQAVYTTGTEAYKVWGVAYQKFPHAEGGYYFGKYFLLTGVTQALATETETVLDEQDTLRKITVLRESFYESANHRFPTRTRVTGGDGTVYTTYMKYPQDYGVVPAGADKPAEMIARLQTANRVTSPLESYSTVLRPGGTAQVQSASLTTHHDFGGTYPLPHEQRVLTGTPLTSFTFSSINATTKKLTYHANYEVVSTAGAYTPTGQLKYQTGQDRIGATTGWGYGNTLPVVTVSQAAPGEFAFSDFETTTGHEFSAQPGIPVAGGHTGLQAIRADVAMMKTITKTTDRYRVTGWLKSTATPVTLTVTISQAGGTTVYTTTPIQLAATGADYVYFERIIPVTASVTSFDVKVQGSFTPPGNGDYPSLDDIAFYPEHATLVSSTYTIPYGADAVTSRNKTAYTVYDRLGRVNRILDQDRNIVQQTSYQMAAPLRPVMAEAYFTYPKPVPVNASVRFTAQDICADATYTWTFDSAGNSVTGISVNHTFTQIGSKAVTLTVTWPGGQSSYTTSVNIQALD